MKRRMGESDDDTKEHICPLVTRTIVSATAGDWSRRKSDGVKIFLNG
jgi:hypothetical protein